MIKRLKERMQIRKTEKAARIILMNKLSDLVEKEAKAKEIEINMIEKLNTEFDSNSLNGLLDTISGFANTVKTNPNISNELFEKIHNDAHVERMAEIEKAD